MTQFYNKTLSKLSRTRVFVSKLFIGWSDAIRELKEHDHKLIQKLERIKNKREERSERWQTQCPVNPETRIFVKGYAK